MNKEIYKQLCIDNPDIPLFSQYWWMEAISVGRDWDVLLVSDSSGRIVASLPFLITKKWGFRCVLQPLLAQTSGIWIKYPEKQTESERLSYEKKVCNDIIAQLDKLNLTLFLQNFYFSFTNWLPFYWKGFLQTTRYTYRIPDISDPNSVFSFFFESKKRQIRKAEKTLSISFELSPEEFYSYRTRAFKSKGKENDCPESLFYSCYNAAIKENKGFIIAVKDAAGNVHAGSFVVWDENSAYYLILFTNPEFQSSGASSLIVWETLKYLSGKTKSFDFEGSMIESIESFYRQFGAVQTPYFQIRKSKYRWIESLMGLR